MTVYLGWKLSNWVNNSSNQMNQQKYWHIIYVSRKHLRGTAINGCLGIMCSSFVAKWRNQEQFDSAKIVQLTIPVFFKMCDDMQYNEVLPSAAIACI